MPARKQITPIANLHNRKPPGCQLEKYNNTDGIMTQTGTGKAMIALNTLNFKELLLILNYLFTDAGDATIGLSDNYILNGRNTVEFYSTYFNTLHFNTFEFV